MSNALAINTASCADAAALLPSAALAAMGIERGALRALDSLPFSGWIEQATGIPCRAALGACALPLLDVNAASTVELGQLFEGTEPPAAIVALRPYHSLRTFFLRHTILIAQYPKLVQWFFHPGYRYAAGLPPFDRSFSPRTSHLVVSDVTNDASPPLPSGIECQIIAGEAVAIFTRHHANLTDSTVQAILTAYPNAATLPLLHDEDGGSHLLDPRGIEIQFRADHTPMHERCASLGLELKRVFMPDYGLARIPPNPADPCALFRKLDELSRRDDVVFAEPHTVATITQ